MVLWALHLSSALCRGHWPLLLSPCIYAVPSWPGEVVEAPVVSTSDVPVGAGVGFPLGEAVEAPVDNNCEVVTSWPGEVVEAPVVSTSDVPVGAGVGFPLGEAVEAPVDNNCEVV